MALVLEDFGRLCQQHKRVLLYLTNSKKNSPQTGEYEEYGDRDMWIYVDISVSFIYIHGV
jgi:hypothetical protein